MRNTRFEVRPTSGALGAELLGIDLSTSEAFAREIEAGVEGIKPGWVRVNFNYFISDTVFEYILAAIHIIATEGWKLLPFYRFNPATGQWRHRSNRAEAVMRLQDLTYRTGKLEYRSRHATEPEWSLPGYLDEARRIIAEATAGYFREAMPEDPILNEDFARLRWFPLPGEAWRELTLGGEYGKGRKLPQAFAATQISGLPPRSAQLEIPAK